MPVIPGCEKKAFAFEKAWRMWLSNTLKLSQPLSRVPRVMQSRTGPPAKDAMQVVVGVNDVDKFLDDSPKDTTASDKPKASKGSSDKSKESGDVASTQASSITPREQTPTTT